MEMQQGTPSQPGLAQPLSKQEELTEVHKAFIMLGKTDPQHLFFIHQVSCPDPITEEQRLSLLSDMLENVPAAIETSSTEELTRLMNFETDAKGPLATLIELREVQQLVSKMTPEQILSLTKGLVPPGTVESQVDYMLRSQEIVQGWSVDSMKQYHSLLAETAPAQQRQKLLELEPLIPWEIVHLIVELINLPLASFLNFADWFSMLTQRSVRYLVNLLQLDTISLLTIRNSLLPVQQVMPPSSPQPRPPPLPPQQSIQPMIVGSSVFSLDSSSGSIPTWTGVATSVPTLNANFSLENLDREYPQDEVMQSAEEGPFSSSGVPSSLVAALGNTQDPKSPPPPQLSPSLIYDAPPPPPAAVPATFSPRTSIIAPPASSAPAPSKSPPKDRRSSRAKSSAAPYSMRPTTPPPSTSVVQQTPPVAPPSVTPEAVLGEGLTLKVVRQPPTKTVYQRILKPFPSLMLMGSESEIRGQNLFVEASLIRADTQAELDYLEGTRVVRVAEGVFATFKKLKIIATSQQQGALFRLRFLLKRYVGNEFHFVPGAVVVSDLLEVFSHTLYLTDKPSSGSTPLPSVSEVLPPQGPVGTKVVVIGANFLSSAQLRVSFGTVQVAPTFHESGALICSIPEQPSGQTTPVLPVRVSNDGNSFCESTTTFTLQPSIA